jgi:hypothetical protein
MRESFFSSLKGSSPHTRPWEVARLLTMNEAEHVSGGLRKIPGLPPITVYYDDGINILTSDPSKSNM